MFLDAPTRIERILLVLQTSHYPSNVRSDNIHPVGFEPTINRSRVYCSTKLS